MKLVRKSTISAYRNVPLVQGVAYPSRTIPRSQVENLKRAYDADLYDDATVTTTAGAAGIPASTNAQLYTLGLGQGVSPIFGAGGKTESDTNVRVSGGMLSLKQAFLADELGFNAYARPGTVSLATAATHGIAFGMDIAAILGSFSVIYKSSSTEIILGLMVDWPAGYGVWSGGAANNSAITSATAQVNNGFPSLDARWKLRMPKDFGQGEDFRMVLNNSGSMTAISTGFIVIRSTYGGVWRDKVA